MSESATKTVAEPTNNTDTISRQLIESVPRDPSAIRPTEHFLRRYSNEYGTSHETRRDPEITGDVIETCIREGTISPGEGRALLYETEVDGHEWRLIVGFKDGPVAVTAYVPGVHGEGDRQ